MLYDSTLLNICLLLSINLCIVFIKLIIGEMDIIPGATEKKLKIFDTNHECVTQRLFNVAPLGTISHGNTILRRMPENV